MKILVIIDPQNDFCHPDGSLYIPNSQECAFKIAENIPKFDNFIVSVDWHPIDHLSNPKLYEIPPNPYTTIKTKKHKPKKLLNTSTADIWPEHCIQHTFGAAIHQKISQELQKKITPDNFKIIRKGFNYYQEQYSADYDGLLSSCPYHLYICGFASSHCVFDTVNDYIKKRKKKEINITLIKDLMLPVPNYELKEKELFNLTENSGGKIITSNEI